MKQLFDCDKPVLSDGPATRAIILLLGCLSLFVAAPGISSASAAGASALMVEQNSVPTVMTPGSVSESKSEEGTSILANVKLEVNVVNRGGASAEGPFTIVDTVGPGLTVSTTVRSEWLLGTHTAEGTLCTAVGNTVTCTVPGPLGPGEIIRMLVPVDVMAAGPSDVTNDVVVSDQAAPVTSSHSDVPVDSQLPSFGFIDNEGLSAGAFNARGETPTAGTHPYSVVISARLPQVSSPQGKQTQALQPLRSMRFELPPGMIVNPLGSGVRCAPARLEGEGGRCPVGSQIGQLWYTLEGSIREVHPIYNLIPARGVPAELGFSLFGTNVRIRGGLSGDFRLTASSTDIIAKVPVTNIEAELWGSPSDPGHDVFRSGENCEIGGCATDKSPAPILSMPSACGPLPLAGAVTSWFGAQAARSVSVGDRFDRPIEVSGCQNVPFLPSVAVRPTSRLATSPTGLGLEIGLPQNETLEGTATATLKKVTVRFPAGVAVNPPAADGLGACSPSQIGLGNVEASACPPSSRVGTAEITTPLLEMPLKGSIYLGEQRNNPFDTLLALYLVVEGEGIVVKLPGRVDADGTTGALTATFDNNPQIPFEKLNVQFGGGPRATLVMVSKCGTYNVRSELTSWASPTPVVIDSPFTVDQGCSNGGFSPKFEAGTANPIAGAYSPFTLRVTRQDGEQNLSRISATLPKGLLAKLAGVALCPETRTASGDCPTASQIGTTTTGVGAGSQPLFIPQAGKSPTAVYLAGSYKGAPYSLVVKVPAQAGPFDLGTIAVRVALNVDPFTAQVTASSDPLPQILEGIPVAYRDVRVDTTRPEFIINPTSCEPMQVNSSLVSISGATASPSSRFQVAGCSSLAFKPTVKLSLTGPTKRTGHPALKAVVTYPKQGANANIARAQVNLPSSEFLDQGNLNKTCTKPVLLAGNCPKTTIYGKAKAWTPLLERPVEGNVYLVGGFGYKLPALVAELNGQIRVLLAGKVDTGPNKGIRNTFEAVPDAPVSRFVLEMKGGKKYGLLENSESLCKKPQHAIVRLNAQSGAVDQTKPTIAVKCRKAKRSSSKKR